MNKYNAMKNFFLLIIVCTTSWSCSNQTSEHSIAPDPSNENDHFMAQTDSAQIQVNTNYPFGCADLAKMNHPTYWEGDLAHYGHLKQPHGQEFEKIRQCFNAIHSAQTIKSPRIRKLELIEIGDFFKNANNLDTAMQLSIDSIRYRLPNMGIYECYYSYQRYGNLIFLDPETNEAKLINIYADDLGGDGQTKLRYFYLEKSEILIFQGACYDDGCSLAKEFKVIINADGSIAVSSLTN
jgi:hypothetical protein